MKILMHICCSNCSIHPLQHLLLQGVDLTGFWFNPNIHPYNEYTCRLESLRKLGRLWNFAVAYDDDYCLDEFLAAVVGKGRERCAACYALRLNRTAAAAKDMGMDCFTTSLLASPYQKFDTIQSAGHEAARLHGIPFLGADFRQGWKTAQALSRELELYRQKYCGCVYSEKERYAKNQKGVR